MTDARDVLLDRLKTDLIGPQTPDEMISDRPTDRYLTGILFPPRTALSGEEDDEAAEAAGGTKTGEDGTGLDHVKAASAFRPSSAGLSFAVRVSGDSPALRVRVEGARYVAEEPAAPDAGTATPRQLWQRISHVADLVLDLEPNPGSPEPLDLTSCGLPAASLHYRLAPWGDVLLVTLAVTNDAQPSEGQSRKAHEEAALFQVGVTVACEKDCYFVPKPDRDGLAGGEDGAASALLYRNVQQWATGHTCSAIWDEPVGGAVQELRTSWLPEATVYAVSAAGDSEFRSDGVGACLRAEWLATADSADLAGGLRQFADAYAAWISRMEAELTEDYEVRYADQGRAHLSRCRSAEQRMRAGIALLESSPEVLDAFRMANAALGLQYSWRRNPEPPELVWRPFQLGFALLCLESMAVSESSDRETMDLLWFPTGGGKTEAYLLLVAFAVFLRRLRAKGDPAGAGVTAIMRYTLRLLTIQQFERAAALICACELIRQGRASSGAAGVPDHFRTDEPISLGLWVGEGATPKTVPDALTNDAENTPVQLRTCPCCHGTLNWSVASDQSRVEVRCMSGGCDIAEGIGLLPVWTVDEDVYRERPALLIGTVDKFAQITRNQTTGCLFGIGTPALPPELIIQDELHLISGPLGSLAGLYETAIDELCRAPSGQRAKVIGSTATIRRAEAQIRALFDRSSFQFPPPGLDHTNSGFAVEDRSVPGRRYVGITTAGRSAKFVQQAAAASLLQSATDARLDDDVRDGYWTLVNYFNSLRELGGALVLMRDDVVRSIDDYAARRTGEAKRRAGEQRELTSRVASAEIPGVLKALELNWRDPEHIDVVLASNMISVGMDVSRLGLMVVNGQPKTIAEYIQATSRVGRSSRSPGLVVTLFNAAKSRDRSRYETFSAWHRSLYREVEATSVTPFAPRAVDRALHAPFIALVRHLVEGMRDPGAIDEHEAEAREILEKIIERVGRIDPSEAQAARLKLEEVLIDWLDFHGLSRYWDDWREALLISAEAAAERGNRPRLRKQIPTPNTMRSVEASTAYVLLGGSRN